ncbi:allatostatin-A receptor-like [Lytechinus variegatus]|uniref:allatostatin-A receptor-like n=1 Tax=Lytechinus variegatus TaxID=7654 RepID=UPI001BB194F9|nr:allatostatin-A receptor-like [Lytechinus variegatus]
MAVFNLNQVDIFISLVLMTSCCTTSHDTDLNSTSDIDTMTTSLSYFNETVVEIDVEMEATSGFTWYPLNWAWWMITQTVLAILGIIGNGIVVVIVYQRYNSMRSTDIMIGALAISDLLTSIFVFPIPWAKTIPNTILGHLYCKLLYPSFFLWFCITAATYILLGICIERYVAIVYPLFFNRVSSKRRTTIFVLGLWLLSFLQVMYTFFIYIYDENIGYCVSTIKTEIGRVVQAYYAITIRLFFPVTIMLITQILIARSLHIQGKRFQEMVNSGKDEPSKQTYHIVARNRIVKMMLIVVLVYVVTWCPNQIAYLCFNLGYITPTYRGSPLHRILTVLGFLNSCINPFIYAARNPAFRSAVLKLFLCSKPKDEAVFSAVGSHTKETKANPSTSVPDAC